MTKFALCHVRLYVGTAAPGIDALLARLAAMAQRQRQRRDLAALDDDRLRDIGVSRAEARAEAAKPFWR